MWHPIRRFTDFKTRVPVVFRYIKLSKDLKRFDTCNTYEVEYPYRQGLAMVFRVIGTHGFQLAVLDNHPDLSDDAIDNRLFAAIHSADGTVEFQAETWEEWRAHVADLIRRSKLGDTEAAEVLDMLGVGCAPYQTDSDKHLRAPLGRS
jgi:hypothetical protein